MKVRITTEFKDKYTGELHKAGSEMDMTIERINEVLKVGNFIELLGETVEQKTEDDENKTTRRKRTGK